MDEFTLGTPDHAYMFAFLQADGHLRQGTGNKGSLTVEVSARDAPILEAFQRLCPHYSSIRYRTRSTNFTAEHTSATWTVCAREFRDRLVDLGIPTGRKSESIAPPTISFSARDYVRGLIDADGSVGRTRQDLPFVGLTTMSEPIKEFFCDYARRLTGIHRTVNRNTRDGVFNVLYTREDVVALARELYYPGVPRPPPQAGGSHQRQRVDPPGRPAEDPPAPLDHRRTRRPPHLHQRRGGRSPARPNRAELRDAPLADVRTAKGPDARAARPGLIAVSPSRRRPA